MKTKILTYTTLFLLLTAEGLYTQPENPGPMKSGWTSATVTRNGRTLNSIIYYPAFTEGSQTQADTISKPYPVIAFGHGFFMQNSNYISLFKHLASHGYVVIAPQFPDVSHSELADDLLAVAGYIKGQNTVNTSPFYNLIDTLKTGLSGHSMGGGASLLAAARNGSVTVAAPLAPAETNPTVMPQMGNIKGVVWLIAGSSDGITPVSTNQQPMYVNALPVKGLVSIKGGNHTKFMDISTWDWTDPNGYTSRQEQLRLTRRYMTAIFNLFLKEKREYFDYAFGTEAQTDTAVTLTYQLRPLMPASFRLIAPSGLVASGQINFIWNRTYSLNGYDTVKYRLTVSEDSLFQGEVMNAGDISDTTFEAEIASGTYYWKVRAYTSDTTEAACMEAMQFTVPVPVGIEDEGSEKNFRLYQNHPNPFNPGTVISYDIPEGGEVSLKIYDTLGREIAVIVDGEKEAGRHEASFNAGALSGGVYIYQLRTATRTSTNKMILIK